MTPDPTMPATRVCVWMGPHGHPCAPESLFDDIEMPPGHVRVWWGRVRDGDLYLSLGAYDAGYVVWLPVRPPPPGEAVYGTAEYFGCLVRRGDADVGTPCERCGSLGRRPGRRFCAGCEAAPDARQWRPARPGGE